VQIKPEILSTKFKTFMATKASNQVIVDARELDQYQGKTSLTNRKGHIPEAINLPWFELISGRDASHQYDHIDSTNTLIDIETLKQKLSVIPADKKVILYCNGGQESSVLYFALKELGRESSVYDGSWFEWSADDNMPISSPL
jgi:thiosulfate/3-mercaptopyruvate sulfurtransferase